MSIDWSPLTEVVGQYQCFLLTSHARADCDALGSELAMAAILESLGKEVRIVNPDAVPAHLQFIDPEGKVEALGDEVPGDVEVLIVLDTSAWIQLGGMADVIRGSTAKLLVIDHHRSSDDLGALQLKDVEAEATGRLVLEAADALDVKIDARIARPLFAAIATDTGWFRFPSVSAKTFGQTARLVDAGARPEELYNQLYERETISRIQLRGCILASAESELEGRLVYSKARQLDFARYGASPSDTEEVINQLLRARGSEVALLFIELAEGSVKVSFRGRSGADVRQIAEQFGGGGHTLAAGATLKQPFEEAVEAVLEAARKSMA